MMHGAYNVKFANSFFRYVQLFSVLILKTMRDASSLILYGYTPRLTKFATQKTVKSFSNSPRQKSLHYTRSVKVNRKRGSKSENPGSLPSEAGHLNRP